MNRDILETLIIAFKNRLKSESNIRKLSRETGLIMKLNRNAEISMSRQCMTKVNCNWVKACGWLLVAVFAACSKPVGQRAFIDLAGAWQFAIDTAGTGIAQRWYLSDLNDSIHLPGTTDLNHKGFRNSDTTTMHLNRLYKYEGPAWYRKVLVIPENFRDKHIRLILERTKSSTVWVDSIFIGKSRLLQSPQEFDLSDCVTPGIHYLTIRIDNSLNLTPYGYVHIYSEDTQTNWNGILGEIKLTAAPKTYISDLQVFPDIENKKITARIGIENGLKLENVTIALQVDRILNGKTKHLRTIRYNLSCDSVINVDYPLGDKCELWDEYRQPVYHLTAVISSENHKDSRTVPFGMRQFAVKGTQFTINGRTLFLRGKHEAAVFPLTGFTPTDVEAWRRVYSIAKTYGINHYRFHSYCPPEAAFTAADLEGIYLQAELPFWGGLESDSVADMLLAEGLAMQKAYANHPSFVMFSHGNEIWSGHDRVERNIIALKKFDCRPLYTMGSNNNIGYAPPRACCDFFVAARTPFEKDTILTHTRLMHAFVDSRDGGILNTQTPSTAINYNYAVSQIQIPAVSHEVGQYQIYPDYHEIAKYTGVLQAWNLEVFQQRLQKAGMADLDSAFQKASGAWSALCYQAEMETALRTPGLAGFQLLDLQDFPGQGTALVGILDAFMDSKNVVSVAEWKKSCNDVVLLLEFPKYCWTNADTFRAKIIVANYSAATIKRNLKWAITNQTGAIVSEGIFTNSQMTNGGLTTVGEICIDLSPVPAPAKLTVTIALLGTDYRNSYPIWVYPNIKTVVKPDEIIIAEKLTPKVVNQLQAGAKVLLFPPTADVRDKSYPGLFPPEFWNYGMFKGISEWAKKPVSPGTLGILTNPDHPLFNSFPTDFHTNWQWFAIIKAGNALILDGTADTYRPIVQVVDNLERNHKLGLICEFRVGRGKLLICMAQLPQIVDKPEARQLYQSILNYMQSNDFNPDYAIDSGELER